MDAVGYAWLPHSRFLSPFPAGSLLVLGRLRGTCVSLTNSLTTHSSASAGVSPSTRLSHLGSVSAKPTETSPAALDQLEATPPSSLQSSQTQGAPLSCQQQSHFLPGSHAQKAKEVAEYQRAGSRLCWWCGLRLVPEEEKIIIGVLPALLLATDMHLLVTMGF